MALIADFLLALGAFGAAIYCFVLSRRLMRFTTLESGMGGAIAVLSAQVDEMTAVLKKAGAVAESSSASVEDLTSRAETVSKRLELLLASMHDLPEAADPVDDLECRKPRFVRRRPLRLQGEAAE